jgi:hypothetical protein
MEIVTTQKRRVDSTLLHKLMYIFGFKDLREHLTCGIF